MAKKDKRNKKDNLNLINMTDAEIRAAKEEIRSITEKRIKRDKRERALRLGVLIILLFLIIMYVILRILFLQGAFTISLDQDFAKKSGIIIFESMEDQDTRRVLEVEKLDTMDNIDETWIPQDIDTRGEGSHNGKNPDYIAYTFYVANRGIETLSYWYSIFIDDVIRDVDRAIRIKVYMNGEPTTYAKLANNGEPEPDTTPFYSDDMVLVEQRKDLKKDEIDRITLVIWIHGPDPDCVDALIGGEMKMHMEITEQQIYGGKSVVRPQWTLEGNQGLDINQQSIDKKKEDTEESAQTEE